MTWSADDEYRTRVLSRRRAVVRLRHPGAAYGPAALVLMYSAGLFAVMSAVTGFSGIDATMASALAMPAAAATIATALGVGLRLRRYEETSVVALIFRVGVIWALFGAAWPMMHFTTDILVTPVNGDFRQLTAMLTSAGGQALAGASVGAIGGLAGGAAASLVCIERAS